MRCSPRPGGMPAPAGALVLAWTAAEAAELLRCKASWLRRKARCHEIPCTMLGRAYHFSDAHLAEVIRILEKLPCGTPAPALPASRTRSLRRIRCSQHSRRGLRASRAVVDGWKTGAGNQAAQRVCTCVPADPASCTSVRDLETSPWQPEPPGPGLWGPGPGPESAHREAAGLLVGNSGDAGASSVPPGRRSQRPSQRQSCDRSVPRSHEAWRPCAPAGLACRRI